MGLETCRQLGRLGYRVIMASRDRADADVAAAGLRGREGIEVEAVRLDLTRSDDIAALLEHLRRRLRRVDVLVNNAGIYVETTGPAVSKRISVFDARLDVVRAVIETNLLGPLALAQGIVALMRERDYGRVVNVTSAMGQLAEMGDGAPGYRIAAVGINALTRIFSRELEGTNVLVNSVDPGWVRTRAPEATRSIEEGVQTTIWLATLPDGGPSGQFFRDRQPIAW
jgi:NAD(P)-dependent dehydrogenase (short-subunit alcohol dehydrogenase family)